MLSIIRKTVILPCASLMLAALSCAALATPSQDLTDARQETQIWTTYALSPYLRANDLKVSVTNGNAVLTGMVDEDVNKDLAKQIALGVTGIKDVDNQIQVQADYKPASKERTYGQMIDDISIAAAIKSKLIWSKSTDGQAIEVTSSKGRVTLEGEVISEDSKAMAKRLATGTYGVLSVTNNIAVNKTAKNGKNDKTLISKEATNISDVWITAKVKSTFLYSSNVAGSDISVTTKSGVVTLSGTLDSGVERALAIELAQNIRGVKKVQAEKLVN